MGCDRMIIIHVSLFHVFILPPQSLALHFDEALHCSLHCVFSAHLYLSALLSRIPPTTHSPLLSSEPYFLSPLCFSFLFECQLAALAASFFDPPLLSQSLNTFNLLSSSLICHSIHSVLPFIISPYRPPPSVLLLLSACLDGRMDSRFVFLLFPLHSIAHILIHPMLILLNVHEVLYAHLDI